MHFFRQVLSICEKNVQYIEKTLKDSYFKSVYGLSNDTKMCSPHIQLPPCGGKNMKKSQTIYFSLSNDKTLL